MGWLKPYESLLRIPKDAHTEDLIRYRAIWLVGVLFMAVQTMNLFTMTLNYGRWTYDHTISVAAMVIVASMVLALRWYKGFHVYAFAFSLLVLFGIMASALPEHMGINSALVPLVIVGPLINGYISGRRAAFIFWCVGIVFLSFLYWVSINHPPILANGTHRLEANRYTNAIYYLTISASLSIMLTEHTFSALKKMRELAERATRAEAAKSEFLAKMSHELRTPLNGVMGLTDAMLRGDLPEREKGLAQTIRQSGDSLIHILNDLLDLSRIEAGKMPINPRPVNARDVIERAILGTEEVIANEGLAFDLKVSESLSCGAQLDEVRVRQVIHNLLSNAVKFTDEGFIAVHADRVPGTQTDDEGTALDYIRIRVRDTGCGISEHARHRIFDSFEQEEHAGPQTISGTGLGLPISRKLVELMGGSIDLEKTGPHGSVFRVLLPLHPVELTKPAAGIERGASVSHPVRVLVVEDHDVNQLVLTEFLRILGVDFEVAEDGIECLEWLRKSEFDVILMDKNMPRMNGMETTRAIRTSDMPFRDVQIIAITADAMVGERERLLECGMDGFLSKPLKIEELAQILENVPVREAAA